MPLPRWALVNESCILKGARSRGELAGFAPVELGVIEYNP